jgi:hypothetical protein
MMRALVLRVWCGRMLRVAAIEDVLCAMCAERYARVQGRAA